MPREPRVLPFVQKPGKKPAPKPTTRKDDLGGLRIRVTVERPDDAEDKP